MFQKRRTTSGLNHKVLWLDSILEFRFRTYIELKINLNAKHYASRMVNGILIFNSSESLKIVELYLHETGCMN